MSASVVSIVIPVYNDGRRALAAAASLARQVLPESCDLEIVVVDDGSSDDTADIVSAQSGGIVRFVRLERNAGRSAACNAGASHARGNVLFFFDCDCAPSNERLLITHLTALQKGHVASVGPVVGAGSGFWHRYQRDVSLRRERRHRRGNEYSGTSSNLAVVRSAFEKVGGFDINYRRYGFEDRDLLLRLNEVGRVAWATGATVRHMDQLTLATVCRKMREAGEHSAERFSDRHPVAYRKLGYAAIDARNRRWLSLVARQSGPHLMGVARRIDRFLQSPWMPYLLAKALVKTVSAASFMYGTARIPAKAADSVEVATKKGSGTNPN